MLPLGTISNFSLRCHMMHTVAHAPMSTARRSWSWRRTRRSSCYKRCFHFSLHIGAHRASKRKHEIGLSIRYRRRGGEIDWGRDTSKRLHKAPTDYTKPQNSIQNLQKHYTKTKQNYTKIQKIRQNSIFRQMPKVLNKSSSKYQFYIKYEISNITNKIINNISSTIKKRC